jgi:hypothetical protein
MVREVCADGPPLLAGQSARACELCFLFDSSLPFSCFRVCFKESSLRLEVDP